MRETAIKQGAIAKRFLLAAIGLMLAYLVAATAAWNLCQPARTFTFLGLLPDDPDITMAQALSEFRATGQQISDQNLAAVHEAARLAPLAAAPFLFKALEQIDQDRSEEAISLLETARQRNPRLGEARLVLLDQYLKTSDATAATREIGALSQLLPEARPNLVSLLMDLASRPETRQATLAELPGNPLRIAVLQELAKAGASSFMLLDMTTDMKGSARTANDPRWIEGVIAQFVNQGDVDGAKRLWQHFHAINEGWERNGVFDGELKGLAGPPFGWKIESGGAGLAELKDGTLTVYHFGRDNIVFARQLLTLAPGRYRLEFKAKHGQKEHANLAWRIDCLVTGATLLDLPLNPTSLFGEAPDQSFIVPETDCPGQWLALTGRPAEFPETRAFALEKVDILPLEAP